MTAFTEILIYLCVAVVVSTADSSNYEESGVNDQEKSFIVDQHNYFRKQVAIGKLSGQPKSSNELQLHWYNLLQYQAQTTADMLQAVSDYDDYEAFEKKHFMYTSSRYDINYNQYISRNKSYRKGAMWNTTLYDWFNEHHTYRFGKNHYNNYTQIVWGSTFNVGCGYTEYKHDNSYYKYYICLYGPAGNRRKQAPYKVGSGCEELCTAPKV